MVMRNLRSLSSVLLLLLACSCSSLQPGYVAAHRAMYNARKPFMTEYRDMVAATRPTTAAAVDDSLKAEDGLISSAERAVKGGVGQ
jgi:hypothetical protein